MIFVILNIIFILGAVALGYYFGPSDEKWFFAWIGFVLAVLITAVGWAVFVIHHFLVRYW